MSNKIYPKLLLVGEQNIGKTSFITNKNIFSFLLYHMHTIRPKY